MSFKCRSGGTPKADNKEYYLGTIPFLSISDINNKYLTRTNKYINEIAINNSSSFIVPKNNLLLTIYATIGVVCINKIDLAIPQSILGIILKDDFNLEFTYYLLLSSKNKFNKYIQTGSQPNLNLDSVNKINFHFPSLQEQSKIATFFSLLDKQIELWEKKLQLVELINDWYKNKIFFNFNTDTQNKLCFFFDIYNGFPFKKNDFSKSGKPILTIKNISTKKGIVNIDICNKIKKLPVNFDTNLFIKNGDLIASLTGEQGFKIAFCNISGVLNQRNIKIVAKGEKSLVILKEFLSIKSITKQINMMATGAQKNISSSQLKNMNISFPKNNLLVESFLEKKAKQLLFYSEKINKINQIKRFFLKNIFA